MAAAPRRPGVVTFIGVILYIQAALATVAALAMIIFSGNDTVVKANSGLTTDALVWSGIVEAVIAVLLFFVAVGIMSGASWARLFVAIVEGLRMSIAVVLMLIHHDGGYLFTGTVTLLIGAFVIWALYGNERSDEYFEAQSAGRAEPPPPPPAATA